MTKFEGCFVAPVNDEGILAQNLMRSPAIRAGLPLRLMRGFGSAAVAYNAAIDRTSSEFLIFLHQDVYLPGEWISHFTRSICELNALDPSWAVLGLAGQTKDATFAGHVWCGGEGRELHSMLALPQKIVSLDELLIVLRRSSGLRFDEQLPGFHLYGTDIVQMAIGANLGAYAIDAPVIHNTVKVRSLRGDYERAYRYMSKKWAKNLPIPTSVVPLTRWGIGLKLRELKIMKAKLFGTQINAPLRRPEPSEVALEVGYETR